jgi:hypothetical protein
VAQHEYATGLVRADLEKAVEEYEKMEERYSILARAHSDLGHQKYLAEEKRDAAVKQSRNAQYAIKDAYSILGDTYNEKGRRAQAVLAKAFDADAPAEEEGVSE